MKDRTLPLWFRLVLVGTTLAQVYFGLTVLLNPEAISGLWPWPLTPISARLLGASTLVSVPLSLLSAVVNRRSAAFIPTVMQLSYRVLQIAAGLIHIDRFDFSRPITWNYFGGGGALMVIFAFWLVYGDRLGRAVEKAPAWLGGDAPLQLSSVARGVLRVIAVVYFGLGLTFLVLGNAEWLWFEAPGNLTPLTARLFASPTMGLALGLWLITRARYWRQVAVPAAGMATFGLAGVIALALESGSIAPPTPVGYLVAATPLVLLILGLFLLAARRGLARQIA